ncbi:PIR protein, putative [Plasmodium sp. gorilla clade G1]|nr:PIR protein, putative [Plasmodium sp. gorilla clade G1]
MKLHYYKILLFYLPLNILEHNNSKTYITPHTSTTTSRILSECDLYMPKYENDADIKSVKENFDRQTSRRFEEYEERIQEKRRKCKEQCDKDIQNIILKDKVQNSLAKKVEKACLKCGCGLGGGVLPVWGLVSGLWYATWSQYVTQTSIQKGIGAVIAHLDASLGAMKLRGVPLEEIITSGNYYSDTLIMEAMQSEAVSLCSVTREETLVFCSYTNNGIDLIRNISGFVKGSVQSGKDAAVAESTKLATNTSILTTSIIVSFVTIVVIVLIIVIIYLILRYRRKKKMNKKLQYTKLLN